MESNGYPRGYPWKATDIHADIHGKQRISTRISTLTQEHGPSDLGRPSANILNAWMYDRSFIYLQLQVFEFEVCVQKRLLVSETCRPKLESCEATISSAPQSLDTSNKEIHRKFIEKNKKRKVQETA